MRVVIIIDISYYKNTYIKGIKVKNKEKYQN